MNKYIYTSNTLQSVQTLIRATICGEAWKEQWYVEFASTFRRSGAVPSFFFFFFFIPSFLNDKAENVCTILESCLSFVRMFGSSWCGVMVAVSNKLGYLTTVLRVETLTGIPLSDIYRRCVSRCQDVAVLIDFYRG